MSKLKITVSAMAITAFASTAFAADFGTLDANADGQVTFAEYSAIATSEGKTKTLAAQEFTRMAQGDAILTEDEFFLADALADQPYALQTITVDAPIIEEPMPFEPVETVAPVETFESYPSTVEVMEPPVETETTEETAPVLENATIDTPIEGDVETTEPLMTEMPLESESAVAGEVVTSDTMEDPVEDMPLEEGSTDLLDELETDTEIPTDDVETTDPDGEIY